MQRIIFTISSLILLSLSSVFSATITANFTSAGDIPVTAASYTATGNDVMLSLGFAPPVGANLTIVKNTGLSFISGQFSNLVHGQTVDLSYGGKSYRFVANYHGGSGNDLVLHWAHQDLTSWGKNFNGQLGNNSSTDSPIPIYVNQIGVLAGKTVVSISAGGSHSLALCSDGTLVAWGRNTAGQLGNNSTISSGIPVLVTQSGILAGKTVVSISAGGSHSLALCSDGTLVAWRSNATGELGNNSMINSSVPVLVTRSSALSGKKVVSISAGGSHSLAVCSDGTVVAWGSNTHGQLGNNSTTSLTVPVSVYTSGVLYGKTVASISAGFSHSLALCSDGTQVSWGSNTSGQLGNNSMTNSSVPVLVTRSSALSGKTVVAVAAGGSHSLALCADGMLVSWGSNTYGQLGNNSTTNSIVPVAVTQSGTFLNKFVVSISAGSSFSLALCSDGMPAAWGHNNNGQLGNNSEMNSNVPVLVTQSGTLAGKTAVYLVAGGQHSLALASASNSPDLSGLSLSVGSLSPLFESAINSYSTSVSYADSSIFVTPTSEVNSAVIRVNGSLVSSGFSSQAIPLNVGINLINIGVTAYDGVTTKTYTVSVTRVGNYDFWKEAVFSLSEQNDPSVSGEQANPAGDGITNLMKYALALNPKVCGVGGLPTASDRDGYLTLTYRKNKQASDVTYTVIAGEGLSSNGWREATTVVSQTDEGDYWLITVRDNVTQAGHSTRFMRLKVTK